MTWGGPIFLDRPIFMLLIETTYGAISNCCIISNIRSIVIYIKCQKSSFLLYR